MEFIWEYYTCGFSEVSSVQDEWILENKEGGRQGESDNACFFPVR